MASYIDKLFGINLSSNNSVIGISQTAQSNYYSLLSQNNHSVLQEMEDYLNYLYYGIGETAYTKVSHENFAQAIEKYLVEKINSYNFDGKTGKVGISKNLRQEKGHSSSISTNVLKQYQQIVESFLARPDANKYIETKGKMLQLETNIKQLLDSSYREWGIASDIDRTIKINKKNKDLIKEIDTLLLEVTFVKKVIPKKITGEILEEGLDLTNEILGQNIEYSVDDLLSILKKSNSRNRVQGEARVTTDEKIIINEGAEIVLPESREGLYKDNKTGKYKSYSYSAYVLGEGGAEIDVNVKSLSGFQQKMDVLYTFPTEDKDEKLRISAKNWIAMNEKKNLGNTDLLAALLRTTNHQLDSILAFGLQANYLADKGKNTTVLHKWAKNIAILDILSGYSQERGNADTLIIQDRLAKRFHAYNMADIFKDMITYYNGGFTGFYLKGYNEQGIESIGFDFHQRLGSQYYRSAILGTLQAQKISIAYKTNHS